MQFSTQAPGKFYLRTSREEKSSKWLRRKNKLHVLSFQVLSMWAMNKKLFWLNWGWKSHTERCAVLKISRGKILNVFNSFKWHFCEKVWDFKDFLLTPVCHTLIKRRDCCKGSSFNSAPKIPFSNYFITFSFLPTTLINLMLSLPDIRRT